MGGSKLCGVVLYGEVTLLQMLYSVLDVMCVKGVCLVLDLHVHQIEGWLVEIVDVIYLFWFLK